MKSVNDRIEAIREEVRALGHDIHEHPELGMEEFHAVQIITEMLEKYGFSIERNVCDIKTSFIASYKGRKSGPVIGFLAEYDALPGLGHGCGHNLIASLAVSNGIALRDAIDEYGGEVRVIGCPAEETRGAKVELANAGKFDDLSVAMMGHPCGRHGASGIMYALDSERFEFFGKSAHAGGAPWMGINALNGVIETFNNINALRGHIEPDARVAGIITDGGKGAGIVPDFAAAQFYIRSPRSSYLREFSEKVKNCARAAALATGTSVEIINFEGWYDDLHTNQTLSERAVKYTKEFGVTQSMEPYNSSGSSDIGNVSYRTPSIHQWFDVTGDPDIGTHTPGLCAGADSDYGYDQMFIVSRAFVKTAEDILSDPAFLADIRAEFDTYGSNN